MLQNFRTRAIHALGGGHLLAGVSPAEASQALSGQKPLANVPITGIPAWSTRSHSHQQSRLLKILAILFVAFLAWASLFSLDKVTRGGGRVLPSVQNQVVQHLEGGIIQQILVTEGQRVKKGQVLFRLANASTGAEFASAQTDLVAKKISLARMDAQIAGFTSFTVPADLVKQAPDIAAAEVALFNSQRDQRSQQSGIIGEQAQVRRAEITGLQARLTNLHGEEKLLVEQLGKLERAFQADAISERDVLDKRSALASLRTRIADVANQIPQTYAQLSETTARRGEVTTRSMQEIKEKAAILRLELAKTGEQFTAIQDKSTREDIRAPMDGIVNKLYIQTVGGVLRPGEPIAEIVPVDKLVMIEARIMPKDRGNIWPGLPATVKISAYDSAIYGGLEAKVLDVSPDVIQDPKGEVYYRVRLRADTSAFGSAKPVIPGMTAEVNIRSGHQTVLDYIIGPLIRIRDSALRE
ncbi:MAG: hypothetical protein RLY97_2061 [Pseudomonadota bacterium]